jgi:hypothetical protein
VCKPQDCRNIQKPACTKVLINEKEKDALMAALTSFISGCDTFLQKAITSAKCLGHLIEWICELA